jgi:YHS domain-containing protein
VEGERVVAVVGPGASTGALTAAPACFAGRRPQLAVMTTDPVCGMELDESTVRACADHEGARYYFCSDACREEFEAHPDVYAGEVQGPGASP